MSLRSISISIGSSSSKTTPRLVLTHRRGDFVRARRASSRADPDSIDPPDDRAHDEAQKVLTLPRR
jgi:hypothetical protein